MICDLCGGRLFLLIGSALSLFFYCQLSYVTKIPPPLDGDTVDHVQKLIMALLLITADDLQQAPVFQAIGSRAYFWYLLFQLFTGQFMSAICL